MQEKENLLIKEQEIIKEKKTAIELDLLNSGKLNYHIKEAVDIALKNFLMLEIEKKKNILAPISNIHRSIYTDSRSNHKENSLSKD